jgi:hypothetical protein
MREEDHMGRSLYCATAGRRAAPALTCENQHQQPPGPAVDPPDTRNLCFSKTVLSFQHDIGVEENKYICGLTSEVYIKIKINLLSISILLKR